MHEGVVLCCLIVEAKGSWRNHEHFIGALSQPSLHGFDAVLLGCCSNIRDCADIDAFSPEQPEGWSLAAIKSCIQLAKSEC